MPAGYQGSICLQDFAFLLGVGGRVGNLQILFPFFWRTSWGVKPGGAGPTSYCAQEGGRCFLVPAPWAVRAGLQVYHADTHQKWDTLGECLPQC